MFDPNPLHLGSPGFRRQSTLGSPVLVEVATAVVVVVVVVVVAAAVEVDRSLCLCVTGGLLVKKNGIFRVIGDEVSCCRVAEVGLDVGVVVVEVPIDIVVRDPGAGRQPWPSDPSTQPGV